MKKSIYIIMIISSSIYGQLTGRVEYKEEGVTFNIPTNWVGQEVEEVFIMGSQKEAGLVAITAHPVRNLKELQDNMQLGLQEGGVTLRLKNNLKKLSDTSVEGMYEGVIDNQKVQGNAIGLLNSYGKGIVIFSLISPDLFSNRTLQIGREVANSVRFNTPQPSNNSSNGLNAAQVTKDLGGNKLIYSESYYSNTPGGGGYERSKEINLCPNGAFTYYGSSYLNFTDPNFDPYRKNGQSHGTWKFIDQNGSVYLNLNYRNGSKENLLVRYKDDKTFLDGGRYYLGDVTCY
ncbi:hypothetical protein D1818_09275 [Aquimarina sp. BL5]|uniref:hypothetical protein n=1 Tax=Aquimarina sp. BL5 TaxID=1714860 RepID=UPI000E4C0F22|nr:hypothetical protein [Aquimarina sp. BL5]AXT51006.1 hypothetical protein D1818_09275 [Aquimarina sp. BL5]RKM90262.1 hypothetical protein D7036_23990 [Aquimarina sp. BL5]